MRVVLTPMTGALNLTGQPPLFVRKVVKSVQDLRDEVERLKAVVRVFRGYYATPEKKDDTKD